MSRPLSKEKQQRLELIQQLAARRKGAAAPAGMKYAIVSSDSDSEEDDFNVPTTAASLAPPSQQQLKRLHKKTEATTVQPSNPPSQSTAPNYQTDVATDSLVSQLQGLGLSNNAATQTTSITSKISSENVVKKPPQPSSSTSSLPNNTTNKTSIAKKQVAPPVPPLDFDVDEPVAIKEGEGLQLGDKGEFKLNTKLINTLYPHQVMGVRWLYGLHKVGAGGILADDMGLGKTMQVSAFLAGLLQNRLAKKALIIAPKTLIAHWLKELKVCGLGNTSHEYLGSKSEREHALSSVMRIGGVLVTTYGMVQHNADILAQHSGHDPDEGPLWDVMILDEGHKLKNPKMQLRHQVESIPVRMRLIISGTPIQNNLMEMHALFDFVCPGLLGDAHAFKQFYERRITEGNDRHATQGIRERGAAAASQLRQTIAPFMLRREKKDVFQTSEGDELPEVDLSRTNSELSEMQNSTSTITSAAVLDNNMHRSGSVTSSTSGVANNILKGTTSSAAIPKMGHKHDFVVWLRLQPTQLRLYQAFLQSDAVKAVLNSTSSPLASILVLRKICHHPALLSERAQQGIVSGAERAARRQQGDVSDSDSEYDSDDDDDESIEGISDEEQEDNRDEKKPQLSNIGFIIPKKKSPVPVSDVEQGNSKQPIDENGEIPKQKKKAKTSKKKKTNQWRQAQRSNNNAEQAALVQDTSWAGSDETLLAQLHTTGFEASCKTVFVMQLLQKLIAEGHKTLVFSQSCVMLDILEAAIRAENWSLCRIDGSVSSAAERHERVQRFQAPGADIPVFLLTSQVGGLGLTLTAATRVIIVDPAWNPAVDNQAVDRSYRLGQTKDVVVYRLISCGTVEEKIYRRQVFKLGLSRTGTEDGEQLRYFTPEELRDLFKIFPQETMMSVTQQQLDKMHRHQRVETPEIVQHLGFLKTLEGFVGVSDNDLLYSKKEKEGNNGAKFGSEPPEVQKAFGSPHKRPKGARPAVGSQEWSGGGDISSMFSKALNLNEKGSGGAGEDGSFPTSSSSKTGIPAGTASGGVYNVALNNAETNPIPKQERRIKQLVDQIEKQENLLRNKTLIASLGDGGVKIQAKVDELRKELKQLQGEEEDTENEQQEMPLVVEKYAPLLPPSVFTAAVDKQDQVDDAENDDGPEEGELLPTPVAESRKQQTEPSEQHHQQQPDIDDIPTEEPITLSGESVAITVTGSSATPLGRLGSTLYGAASSFINSWRTPPLPSVEEKKDHLEDSWENVRERYKFPDVGVQAESHAPLAEQTSYWEYYFQEKAPLDRSVNAATLQSLQKKAEEDRHVVENLKRDLYTKTLALKEFQQVDRSGLYKSSEEVLQLRKAVEETASEYYHRKALLAQELGAITCWSGQGNQ